jgi:hypothetical protein
MKHHDWLLCLSLLSGVTAGHAQSNTDRAARLALEVEWVRSPRVVLNINAAPPQAQAGASTPDASPVVVEPNLINDFEPQVWSLQPEDKRLSAALNRWAQQAGWQIVWEAERDFIIESSLHLSGDFLKSVSTVMQSLASTDYPLQAKANRSTLTVRISRYQDAGNR